MTQPPLTMPPTDREIAAAADAILAGDLVAMPTETVYGLAADATNGEAVARIYALKGRPRFNPLIAHAETPKAALSLTGPDHCAARLAEAFWPGPLTIVLPLAPKTPEEVHTPEIAGIATAGLDSIAVRVPAHPVARALLEAVGRPLVAPSANRSGRVSPTTAAHVHTEFPGALRVLDGGPASIGLESTIISLLGSRPMLLRPGYVTKAALEAVLGHPVATQVTGAGIIAPGMLTSHYAPKASVRLNAQTAAPGEVLLGFGGTEGATLDLSVSGDLIEAAANLFGHLRRLDEMDAPIAVAPIPAHGLGEAICDRLARAAAPRG